MKENIEEVIKFLQGFNDGYTFQQCQTCFKFNEKDSCCNKEKCEELKAIEFLISDYKRVSKENEELRKLIAHKNGYTQQLEKDLFENCCNYVIPKQKIKDKIEKYKDILDFARTDKSFYTKAKIEVLENIIKDLQELLEEKGNKI